MKIAHITKTYYPDTWGGIEEVIHQIGFAAAKRGLESKVVTLSDAPQKDLGYDGMMIDQFSRNFTFHSIPVSFQLLREFRKATAAYDILHLHYPWPFMDLCNLIARPKQKIIVSYHCDAASSFKLVELCYAPLQKSLLSRADRIIAASPNIVDSSATLAKFCNKCEVIPYGIDEDSYPVVDDALLQKWRDKFPGKFVLFVGVLRHYKGLEYLLAAAKEIKGDIVIVGDGKERSKLEQIVAANMLTNVHFLGFLPHEDKMALCKLARALVLPSHLRAEAFGICLLEGLMSGTPLVSTELGTGTSFVNQNNETGFVVQPRDPLALVAAMNKIIADDDLAAKFGINARKRFEKCFIANNVCEQYMRLYETVLSS